MVLETTVLPITLRSHWRKVKESHLQSRFQGRWFSGPVALLSRATFHLAESNRVARLDDFYKNRWQFSKLLEKTDISVLSNVPCDGVAPPEGHNAHVVYSHARYSYGITRL